MKLFSLIFSLVLINQITCAATFIPLSLEKQFEDAAGVIKGKFVGLEYRKISDGKIITEATFQIHSSAGIRPSEIVNKNNFKVVYPGGKWQGLGYAVSGAPNFKKGEEALVVLKKSPHGFAVKGLGLGKYIIVKSDNKEYYKSSVFPGHEKLGKISQREMNTSLNKIFGEVLENKTSDKFVFKPKQSIKIKKGRMPASISQRGPASEHLDKKEDEGFNPLWLVLLFALLGSYSIFSMRKVRK
jgi:hypothetical protein